MCVLDFKDTYNVFLLSNTQLLFTRKLHRKPFSLTGKCPQFQIFSNKNSRKQIKKWICFEQFLHPSALVESLMLGKQPHQFEKLGVIKVDRYQIKVQLKLNCIMLQHKHLLCKFLFWEKIRNQNGRNL